MGEDEEKEDSGQTDKNYISLGVSLGLCFGAALGSVFHNLAMGISLGLCIGVAVGSSMDKKKNDRDEEPKK